MNYAGYVITGYVLTGAVLGGYWLRTIAAHAPRRTLARCVTGVADLDR